VSLRVAIDAQIPPGGIAGGAEQFIGGLVAGLADLGDEDLDIVVVLPDAAGPVAGLEPGEASRRVRAVRGWIRQSTSSRTPFTDLLGTAADRLRSLWRYAQRSLPIRRTGRAGVVDAGDFYRRLGVDLLHVAHQRFVRTPLPTVYTPHDLQHEHHPEHFSPADLETRRAVYPAGCREARAVVADARCVAHDIVVRYGVDPARVFTVPAATPLAAALRAAPARLGYWRHALSLPDRFAFYPAQTWPHKNHIGLLRALAILRSRNGIRLDLVCTGARNDHFKTVAAEMDRLGLREQVRFLGYLGEEALCAVYRSALFAFNPSLFEGAGLTVLEAFHAGVPVACSALTSLPEYAGDAALLFDPRDDGAVAGALQRMATDSSLRRELVVRGSARSRLFSTEAMARRYRVIYRLAANLPVDEAERRFLAATPLDEPRSSVDKA
jgi:glycosyltransferase involved in cell wall biosynthesis